MSYNGIYKLKEYSRTMNRSQFSYPVISTLNTEDKDFHMVDIEMPKIIIDSEFCEH